VKFEKNKQYIKFCLYGFLKNLRFYDAFLLIFFLENGITFSQIGILYAAREITMNVLEIPSGIIADTFGRKNSLLAALFFSIVAFITFYYSTNFGLLLLSMLLIGLSDAFRSGTHKGMIMDYLKIKGWEQHKIEYYGHTRSWSQKGSAISALMAGIIVFYSRDYRIIYLIAIVPYLLNLINIYTYPKALNKSLATKNKQRLFYSLVVKKMMLVLKKRRVLELINSSALHSAYLKSIKDYIQPIMVNLAIFLPIGASLDVKSKSGLTIGIAYFFIYLLTSYASKSSGKISSLPIRNIEKKTLLFGLTSGILCGLLFYFNFWLFSLLLFVLIYIIENLRKPILTGFLADNVENEILTSVISAQSFYSTIATSVLAILIGAMADYFGIGMALILISSGLFLLTLLLNVRIGGGLKRN